MHINSWFTVAHVWMYCSFLLVSLESCTCWFLARNHLLNLSAKAKRCRIHLSKRHHFAIANFNWSIFLLALQLVDVIFFLSFDQHLLSTYDQPLLLSSTTDQISHFRMRPVLFPLKRPNEQESLPCNLIHLTAAQLLMTSRLLKSSISLDDVTTAKYFSFSSIQTFLLHNC
ncbi:neutral ceramidase-like [Dorcoceras hygrometricum]|uniref:Neutral ceramidase-like n=1 Tax=Dorcoceras hygrometricum TaxID=472368 RepID=A0A2Z7B5B5_9LAMI|nr:neutral ceramidase-like [Dorcoceras hygrometricum]